MKKLRTNRDSTVTLMLQFDDYGEHIAPTTIKLVYTSRTHRSTYR